MKAILIALRLALKGVELAFWWLAGSALSLALILVAGLAISHLPGETQIAAAIMYAGVVICAAILLRKPIKIVIEAPKGGAE